MLDIPVQLSGCDPGKERWEAVEKGLAETASIRGSAFFDMHIMLGFCHGKVTQSVARMALAEDLVKVCDMCACGVCVCATYVHTYIFLREACRTTV